jgi:hypothetical protein
MKNIELQRRELGMTFLRVRRSSVITQIVHTLQLIGYTAFATAAIWGFLKLAFMVVAAYQ